MIRIVKVGGSLLDWPELGVAIESWLEVQSPAFNVLIAGGGPLANVVRKADRDFGLGEEVSHWLCVDAMSINARVLAGAMPRRTLVSGYADLKADTARMRPNVVIFDPGEFLAEHESRLPGRPLPHDWTVTSDSIAARVAEILAADELMLLKSSDPPAATLNDLAAAGYVDRYFPAAAANLSPPRLVNLRGSKIGGAAF